MAVHVFSVPVFLVGFVTWLTQRLTSRSFMLAAAVLYFTSLMLAVGSIIGLLAGISAVMPAPVSTALSVVAPSDWLPQTGVVIASKTTEIVWQIFFRSYRMAVK